MVDKKVSDESAAATLTGTETLRIVQGGASVRTTVNDVLSLVAASTGLPWVMVMGRTHADIVTAVAAVNALTNGGVLYFPAGAKYATTGGHSFTKSVVIRGDGTSDNLSTFALSWIQCSAATADLFQFTVNTAHVYDIFLQNTAGTPTAGCGLHQIHGDGCRFVDVAIDGFYNNYQIDNAGEWFIDRCFSYRWVNYGMLIANVAAPDGGDQFLSNYSSVSGVHSSASHIRYESGGGLKIVNAKLNSRGGVSAVVGIDVAMTTGAVTSDFLLSNISIENISGTPIKMRQTGSGQLPQMVISNIQASIYGATPCIDIQATSVGQFDHITLSNINAHGSSGHPAINLVNVDNVSIGAVVVQGHDSVVGGTGITNLRNSNARLGLAILTYTSTITPDLMNADNYRVVLTGNTTLANPTNVSSGQTMTLRVKQDGTGSRTMAYGSKFKFPGGTAPVLSTTANALDVLTFQYDGIDDTYCLVASKAFS